MEALLQQTNEEEITYLEIYEPVFYFQGRYIHLKGGRSAGRSRFAVTYFLLRILAPDDFIRDYGWSTYFRGYFMRFVASDIRESLYRDFCDLIEDKNLTHLFEIKDHEMTIRCKLNGNMIISKGFRKSQGSRTAKMKSIAGATHVIIEEADEVEENDFRKLDESLRTVKGDNPQIIMCYNTENPDWWGWREQDWYSGAVETVKIEGTEINLEVPTPNPEVLIIHGTMYHNLLYTHEKTRRVYENYKDRYLDRYKITVLGERAIAREGQILKGWQIIDEFPDSVLHGFGLDFGFSEDPTALIKVGTKGKNMYWDEYIYETGLVNKSISERCRVLNVTKSDEILADSDPKDIYDLRNTYDYKLNIRMAYKGPGSIEYGYRKLLEYDHFITRRSKNVIFEFNNHIYAKDADGNPTRRPEDKYNHAIDAGRMWLQTKRRGGRYF